MKKTLLILPMLAICLPAFAVGKVTTDPNTSAAPQKVEISGDDARLRHKVTLSEPRKLVSVVLDDLTKQTGVVFRAGYNSNDWQVRDRRMSIFAKDVPLGQLMNSISHVMKFKWDRKGEDGKWQYRLYMDRRTLLDADARKAREDERVRDAATEKRLSALEAYKNADHLTPWDLAKLKTDDPLMYFYVTSGIAGAFGQMFREVPALSEAMASREEVTLAGSDMSDSAKAGLRRLTNTTAALIKLLHEGRVADNVDPSNVTIQLNCPMDTYGQSDYLVESLLLGNFNVQTRGYSANFPMVNPESAVGRACGRMLINYADGKVSGDVNSLIDAEVLKNISTDLKTLQARSGEPEIPHSADSDPALDRKVKLDPKGKKLADVQSALADVSGFAVVSDSFGKNEGAYDFVKKENKLSDVLDQLAKSTFYNWDKNALVVEFRDREWFRKRTAQIPEATLEAWRQTTLKTGTLGLDALSEIAKLDQEQYNQNVKEDDVLGNSGLDSVVLYWRDVLRVYASLTDAQKKAIVSDSGLDTDDLSADQRDEVAKTMNTRWPGFLTKPDTRMTLNILGKPSGKQISYAFSGKIAEDGHQITIRFVTPKYEQPKPADKPEDASKPANLGQAGK